MKRAGIVASALLAACVAPPPPAPVPISVPVPVPVPVPAVSSAPAAEAAVPAPPRPALSLTIEPPFRLDRRIFPKTRVELLADLADRTRWNRGGLGTLAAPLPPVPGHPAPKVIIDVTKASGARRAADVQRALRRSFWGKTVECFRLSAYKDQELRGTASLSFGVSAGGKISRVRVTRNGFPDHEVSRCLADRLRAVPLPRAKGRSVAVADFQIGHGDEPVPPPASLVVPGDGELTPEQMRAVVEGARPAFEACYRAALEYAPELWGRLGIRFHVTEKGVTDEVFEAESQFPDERVTLCVLRVARKLRFPVPAGGDLRFVVPLRLSPGGGNER